MEDLTAATSATATSTSLPVFTPYLVGVRLFPIQAVESPWVFGIIVVGSVLVLSGHQPGTALSWYVIAYGMGRFFFEFMRGEPDRLYYWDFSQAQWIFLILIGMVASAELSGLLPFHPWHIGAIVCLPLAVVGITMKRHLQKTAKHRLLHPRHVREVVKIIKSDFEESTDRYEETGSSKGVHVAQCENLRRHDIR